jgi:hypothetical protein
MRERDGLIARVRQMRRLHADADEQMSARTGGGGGGDQLQALEVRIAHLEQVVQGLQDSVHREWTRQGKKISELEARTQPAALARALSEDTRKRGL